MIKILSRSFLVLAWIGLGLVVQGFIIEPHRLVVNNTELQLSKWDERLNGVRIVAISDIHGGSNFVSETRIRAVVQRANEQQPDVIVLLGDYVSQNYFDRSVIKMPMADIARALGGLKARYGVYAVLGNHDQWYDNDGIAAELRQAGITVLDDTVEPIRTGNGEFWLVGLKDILPFKSRREYSDRAKRAIDYVTNPAAPIVALTHNPDAAMMITDNREGNYKVSDKIAVLLAGHTHGGQVRIPFYGAPMVPSSFGYTQGRLTESGLDMFITPGIGTSIMPVRFGVPPEISVVTLYRAN